MNDLIEGQDRQLSTMLEEILISGDPDTARAGGQTQGTDNMGRTESIETDECSALLNQDNESSSPAVKRRKPIRGSSSFPNGVGIPPGSQPASVAGTSGRAVPGSAERKSTVGTGKYRSLRWFPHL